MHTHVTCTHRTVRTRLERDGAATRVRAKAKDKPDECDPDDETTVVPEDDDRLTELSSDPSVDDTTLLSRMSRVLDHAGPMPEADDHKEPDKTGLRHFDADTKDMMEMASLPFIDYETGKVYAPEDQA